MNPEQQRIAIAEWCGWRIIRTEESRGRFVTLVPPKGTECPDWPMFEEGDGWKGYIPDYLNDLNAMHEAESKLELPEAYASRLGPILLRDGVVSNLHGTTMWHFAFTHATAAQRAEALLKTLDLWKD